MEFRGREPSDRPRRSARTPLDRQHHAPWPFDRLVEPQPAMREDVCTLIEEAGRRGYEVFVIVNNKAEGSSPLTVRALAERLVERAGTSA